MKDHPDVECDLWIIREWQAKEALRSGNVLACNALLEEELDDEKTGYELPENYSAGPRLHVFASDDCEVWLGCLNPQHIKPTQCGNLALLVSSTLMNALIQDGGPYALLLDGRAVVDEYRRKA